MSSRLCQTKSSALIVSFLLLQAGCQKAEVAIYEVPKEDVQAAAPAAPAVDRPVVSGTVEWEQAPHWEELESTAFRIGNYRYETEESGVVEITVSSFPGATGGLLANVNRWLGQAGLEPVDKDQLAELVQRRELPAGVIAAFVDLNAEAEDPAEMRIYAATFEHAGQSWFFKMSGPVNAVGSQLEAFDEMMNSVEVETNAASVVILDVPTSAEESIDFTVPEGWVPSEGSDLRIASFKIEKEGLPPADFSLTAFEGDTGGTVANVNRWRRQIGLSDWTEAQTEQHARAITNGYGLEFQFFDLKSESGQRSSGDERILVAILAHEGMSWFFKLRGDTLLVDTQLPKFNALLESVHFHAPGTSHQ